MRKSDQKRLSIKKRREEKRRDEVLLLIRKLGYDMMDGWRKDLKDAQVEELDS